MSKLGNVIFFSPTPIFPVKLVSAVGIGQMVNVCSWASDLSRLNASPIEMHFLPPPFISNTAHAIVCGQWVVFRVAHFPSQYRSWKFQVCWCIRLLLLYVWSHHALLNRARYINSVFLYRSRFFLASLPFLLGNKTCCCVAAAPYRIIEPVELQRIPRSYRSSETRAAWSPFWPWRSFVASTDLSLLGIQLNLRWLHMHASFSRWKAVGMAGSNWWLILPLPAAQRPPPSCAVSILTASSSFAYHYFLYSARPAAVPLSPFDSSGQLHEYTNIDYIFVRICPTEASYCSFGSFEFGSHSVSATWTVG